MLSIFIYNSHDSNLEYKEITRRSSITNWLKLNNNALNLLLNPCSLGDKHKYIILQSLPPLRRFICVYYQISLIFSFTQSSSKFEWVLSKCKRMILSNIIRYLNFPLDSYILFYPFLIFLMTQMPIDNFKITHHKCFPFNAFNLLLNPFCPIEDINLMISKSMDLYMRANY